MNYFINEYSLRGQFQSVEAFFDSLRENTIPVLKRIEEEEGNVVWKKDTLWQAEICQGISLSNIPQKKNERSPEIVMLQIELMKLYCKQPFWTGESEEREMNVKEYQFDEEYRENFDEVNCFTKAIECEGRIISFFHKAYQNYQLPVMIEEKQGIIECILDNIFEKKWWQKEPEIKTWRIQGKYVAEVRAKEFEYHPPHFHVSYNEFAGVFKLRDGSLYTRGKNSLPPKMIEKIGEWYKEYKEELQEAWRILHSDVGLGE